MTYLKRGQTNGTSAKTFTVSTWVKLGINDNEQRIFDGYDGGGYYFYWKIRTVGNGHTMQVLNYQSSTGGTNIDLITNRKFRDCNSWYHFCLQVDTTQSTASNRVKIYVNGVQETSLSTATYPPINTDLPVSVPAGADYYIGKGDTANYALSHYHYIDGSIIDVGQFGSVDSTTGEWKINTSPTVSSYGTNGFAILKDGTTITDQSPNSNNYSSNGTALTKTEDSPSNVFATLNPLDNKFPEHTFTYGNTTSKSKTGSGAPYTFVTGTLGMTSGKYYWEAKLSALQTATTAWVVGITSSSTTSTTTSLGSQSTQYGYNCNTGVIYNAGSTTYGASCALNDILGVAVDMDNNKIYWSKNGTWQNSGNPASGSTGTGAFSITAPTGNIGAYLPAWSYYQDDNWGEVQFNFGNGYFGTTAVSSAGSNASGIGIFEYDVPTGYTALSTKGLNL